jgi:hypothetical protein
LDDGAGGSRHVLATLGSNPARAAYDDEELSNRRRLRAKDASRAELDANDLRVTAAEQRDARVPTVVVLDERGIRSSK